MVQDRGHGGLWFIGFAGIEVPVSVRLGGGHETDAWRVGQALDAAGVVAPEAGVISALLAALRREGVSILAREPALEAPPASRRVWSCIHRPDIWAEPHCAPGAEAVTMIATWTTRVKHYDLTTRREVASIDAALRAWFESGDLFPLRIDGEWIVSRDSSDPHPAGVVEVTGIAESAGFPVTFWVAPAHAAALRATFPAR